MFNPTTAIVTLDVTKVEGGFSYRFAAKGSNTMYDLNSDCETFAEFQRDAQRVSGMLLTWRDLSDDECEKKWQSLRTNARKTEN